MLPLLDPELWTLVLNNIDLIERQRYRLVCKVFNENIPKLPKNFKRCHGSLVYYSSCGKFATYGIEMYSEYGAIRFEYYCDECFPKNKKTINDIQNGEYKTSPFYGFGAFYRYDFVKLSEK